MIYKGIARGRIIELEEPLPYQEGQRISVSVEPTDGESPLGSATRILGAMHEPPHLDGADVDELERAIQDWTA